MNPTYYSVYGFEKQFYCKVTPIVNYNRSVSYTVSFGGKDTYCMIIAIDSNVSTEAYIDRVEYNEACIKEGVLEETGGTYKLVKSALWSVILIFPLIQCFRFKDNSYLYCEKKSKLHKLNLAYDYVIKYGQTWYEKNFSATLPESLFNLYKKSLDILNNPLVSYEQQVKEAHYIQEYESIYKLSKSPREFITNIKKEYKEDYCFRVGKWLDSYMDVLNINIYNASWVIFKKDIQEIDNFRLVPASLQHKGGKTRTKSKKNKQFKIIFGEQTENNIGYYYNFE